MVIFLLPSLILGAYWVWREGLDSGLKNFTWYLAVRLLITGISVSVFRRNFGRENSDAFDWWQDELQQLDAGTGSHGHL